MADYLHACGLVVLVMRTAGGRKKHHVETKRYFISKTSNFLIKTTQPFLGTRTCLREPSCLHAYECELQKFVGLCMEYELFHAENVNLKSTVVLFSNVMFVLPRYPRPFSACFTASLCLIDRHYFLVIFHVAVPNRIIKYINGRAGPRIIDTGWHLGWRRVLNWSRHGNTILLIYSKCRLFQYTDAIC